MSRDFAIVHVIHWFLLAVAVSRSNFEIKIERVLAGTIPYLCIVLFPYLLKIKYLDDKKQFRFQCFYIYYTWFIMLMTYISRVKEPAKFSGTAEGYQVCFITIIATLLMNIYFIYAKKKKYNY